MNCGDTVQILVTIFYAALSELVWDRTALGASFASDVSGAGYGLWLESVLRKKKRPSDTQPGATNWREKIINVYPFEQV
tara:strand:+ start:599 stop:835 length:237 start_codon:yes stop_codon:yes gene_type:complete